MTDYVRALNAATDWLTLSRVTQNRRHLDAAIACSQMARERLPRLLAEGLDAAQHQALRAIEIEAQTAAHVDEVRQQLAESLRLLEAPVRYLPGIACA